MHQNIGLHVIGTGTALDSGRLRTRIARQLDLDSRDIDAYCLGEHGDSQMVPCIVGRGGATEIIELNLTEKEKEEFSRSCEIMREIIERLEGR